MKQLEINADSFAFFYGSEAFEIIALEGPLCDLPRLESVFVSHNHGKHFHETVLVGFGDLGCFSISAFDQHDMRLIRLLLEKPSLHTPQDELHQWLLINSVKYERIACPESILYMPALPRQPLRSGEPRVRNESSVLRKYIFDFSKIDGNAHTHVE